MTCLSSQLVRTGAGEARVEGGGLPLLLRAVLRVGLDAEPEELTRRGGQVLAHRDRTPATHRVDAQGNAAARDEVHVRAPLERQLADTRVGGLDALLPDLELGQVGAPADEVDPQVEVSAPGPPLACCRRRR